MIMYKLIKSNFTGETNVVLNLETNFFIPFDPANTDYQTFKKEVLAGAELQDADGNVMTDSAEYVRTLP
jgi:hypothetical protein